MKDQNRRWRDYGWVGFTVVICALCGWTLVSAATGGLR